MKKILLSFLVVMVSFFATAQEWHHPFGWRDTREFGIVNDSSADVTAGLRLMMAAFPSKGGTAIIPPGRYRVSDTVGVPTSVNIIGEGGDNTEIGSAEGTDFYFSSATKNFLVVVPPAGGFGYSSQNRFENFNVWNVSAGATAGSGIYIYNGEGFILRNVMILGFWDDITIRAGNIYTIENCKMFNYVNTGLTMGNNVNADLGDMTITGVVISTGLQSAHQPLAGLLWLGSGGLKMSNSKFNAGGLGTTRNKYAISLTGTDGNTSDLLFSNISLENFDSSAIYSLFANEIRGLVFSNIQTYGPNSKGPAINLGCVSLGTGSGMVGISNYVLGTYGSGSISQPAIKINNLNQISIGPGIITDYTSTNSITNSTNVSVFSGYNTTGDGGMTMTNKNSAGGVSYISTSDIYSGEVGSQGSTRATYGDLVPNVYYVYSSSPAGIAIMVDANAPFTVSTGSGGPAAERLKISGTGIYTIPSLSFATGASTDSILVENTSAGVMTLKKVAATVSGQTTLIAGTKTISITGAVAGSVIQVTLLSPNTATNTVMYQGSCTTGSCTIQANLAATTINIADVSTVQYTVTKTP